MRAQLRKPGACGVLSLEVKYDPASRLKCTATLVIDDIQHSRKSCHDEYKFRTVPFTIPCCKLHFYHPKLLHIKFHFPNAANRLLYYPSLRSIQFTTQNLRGHVSSPDQCLSSKRGKSLGTRLETLESDNLSYTLIHKGQSILFGITINII